MTEKEAIEYLKTRLSLLHRNYQFATEQAIETVLNLIQTQDKIIDLMAEQLVQAHEWFYSEFDNYNKEDFKEYFINKVEKER